MSQADPIFEVALAGLSARLLLEKDDLNGASEEWSKTRTAILNGSIHADLDLRVSIRDQYLSLHRYCNDATELMQRHVENGNRQIGGGAKRVFFVLDPHLLRAWSEYWDPRAHTGFKFLKSESGAWKDFQFETYIYDTLFSNPDGLALLDVGRTEVSEILNFFAHERRTSGFDIVGEAERLADRLADLSDSVGGDDAWLKDRFDELIDMSSTPVLRQNLALARLTSILQNRKFWSPEVLLRQCLNEVDHQDAGKVALFSALMRRLRSDGQVLASSRNAFLRAYDIFREAASIVGEDGRHRARKSMAERSLRGGELLDVKAMHELHVLNACLEASGLNCEFVYVTLSARMYNFCRVFDRSRFYCRLLHPRWARMVDLDDTNLDEFTHAISAVAALNDWAQRDESISASDLDEIERRIGGNIENTRNSFAFGFANKERGRNHIIRALRELYSDDRIPLPIRKNGLNSLDVIGDFLSTRAEAVYKAYEDSAPRLRDNAWSAYQQLSHQVRDRDQDLVLVRKVKDGAVVRHTCIPLSGGYRHMFVLHADFIQNLFPQVRGEPQSMTMFELLTSIQNEASRLRKSQKSSSEGAVFHATEYFARALFAAADRDWMLSHTFAQLAHETLRPHFGPELAARSDGGSMLSKRIYLIDQEILFLRHMCRRALAEASSPGRRLDNWLRLAAEDLNSCADYVIRIERELHPFRSATNPVSIRIALAAIGIQIEWMQQRHNTAETYYADELGLMFPKAASIDVAWHGEPIIISNALNGIDGLEILARVASRIGMRCEAQLEACNSADVPFHSLEFWRFLTLRARAMEMLVSVYQSVIFKNEPGQNSELLFDREELDVIDKLQGDHDKFCAELISPDKSGQNVIFSVNPFMSGLIASLSLAILTRNISKSGISLKKFADDYDIIDKSCVKLDRFGFPRFILKSVKDNYINELVEFLIIEHNIKLKEIESRILN